MRRFPPRPVCHHCNVRSEGPVPNPKGGAFWLCRRCDMTWNLRDGKCNGDPAIVAPASSRRGRCTSAKESLVAKLVARNGFSRAEAEEFLSAFGVNEVERMLG